MEEHVRLSVMTLNVWGTNKWERRKPVLKELMKRFRPDILCLQEAREEVQDTILETVPEYKKVEDRNFPGWTSENNIIWNSKLFGLNDYGNVDIGGVKPNRQLCWARLELEKSSKKILVLTAHYAWAGHGEESKTGKSPRVEQSRKTLDFIKEHASEDEYVLFMGDLNEPFHPRRILNEGGIVDVFTRLGIPAQPTRPARPIDNRPDETDDWIFCNQLVRPLGAMVVKFYHQEVPPSDHWPVLAFFEIGVRR